MRKVLAMIICLTLLITAVPAMLPVEISVSAASGETTVFDGYEGEIISVNGDFENVTADNLTAAGWAIPADSLAADAADAHGGSAYLKLAAGNTVTFTAGNMPEGGYMLRGYYKHLTDGTTAASQIYMQQVNVASSNYNTALIYTNTWTKFGMMLNANQLNGETGSIRFMINNAAGCATLCLDDLELIRLDNYDKRNIIQNPGFDVNDIDAAETIQHHYASWFNNGGTHKLVSDAHTGGKALSITNGSAYTYAFLPKANAEGKKYEFSGWLKWANGASFAANQAGITAPVIGLETYENSTRTYGKDYALTVANGITGSDWCHVKLIFDAESTPVGLTSFRLFLKSGTGETIWDDVAVKPVETCVEIMDSTGTKTKDIAANESNVSYTARAQYAGADGTADGTLYIAAYNVDSSGNLVTVKENSAVIKADGKTTLCTLDGVSANTDTATVVKALIKDANNNIIKQTDITNAIKTGPVMTDSFENISGTQPENATEWVNASVTSEDAYSGDYSIKLSGNNARALFEIPGVFQGNEYTLSFRYKGSIESGDGLVVRRLQWVDNAAEPVYKHMYDSEGKASVNDWTLYTYTFTQYEGTVSKIGPMLKNGTGTVYIDDITLTPSEDASAARVVTDQVFYYSDLTGKGTATVYLDNRFAGSGCKADIRLKDGDTVLKEALDVSFTNNKAVFEYELSLLSELKKEYCIEASVTDASGYVNLGTYTQKIYKYDRPSTVSKDGSFTDIKGKRIDPTFMYHIPYEDFATAASAGINVVQYSPPSSVTECLAQLDAMYEMGVYAGVVCYWGMYPAGNAVNHDRVRDYIAQIKHHPAIFCYMIMDEPFLNNPNAYEDLRKSYIMLREADPDRPTYICEGFPAYMEDVAKYCDIIAPDPYPTGVGGDMATYVSDMVGYAHGYVNYDKPVLTILQAFTQAGVKPTATELHSMMYQSLMAGGNALGFYTWTPDNAEVDKNIDEDIYWPMLQTFYAKEKSIVYDYYAYGKGEAFNSDKGTGSVWYEGFTDEAGENLYIAVQNRSEDTSVTATIPLVSQDKKVTVSDYTAEIVGYGADTASITDKTAGSFKITLAPCQAVLCKITTEDILDATVGENLIVNGGFETLSGDAAANFSGFGTWTNGSTISIVSAADNADNVHGGNYAVKYVTKTGDNPFISQSVSGILARGKYKLSFWYKGTTTGSGFSVKFEQYGTGVATEQYSNNFTTSAEWKYVEYEFYAKDGVNRFSVMPRCYTEGTEIYIDNLRLMLVGGPEQFDMSTDQVFYYEDYDKATVTLTMDEFYEDTGYSTDLKIADANGTYVSASGLSFTDNKLVYQADITSLGKKTEYQLTVTIKDNTGAMVETITQPIYRFDRPTAINEDGVYMIDGEPFEPVIAYHFDMNDYEDAKKAGINVVQWSASSSDKEVALAELDALQQAGMMAAVVCYWGMAPAGHSNNAEKIQQFVTDIKDHPAVFCYMVMDEPFSNRTKNGLNMTEEEMEDCLRNSYKIIRTVDDVHPVYLCEDQKAMYPTSAKYVDCLGIDPYPGTGDFGRHVADMTLAAREGTQYEKPVYVITQAMSWKGITPTPEMLRTQLYQAMMSGAQGYGYFPWIPEDATLDTDLNEGRYWTTMLSFYEKDHPLLFGYYGRGEYETFNKYSDNDLWYESWVDGSDIYMAVLNRTSGDKTATVSLGSTNGRIVIDDYTMSVVNGGDMTAVTKAGGSFTVNMSGYQAVLYKITPAVTPDYSWLNNIAENGDFESLTDGVLDTWSFAAGSGVTAPTQAEALKTESNGNNYINLTAATTRVESEVSGVAGNTYLLKFDYKSTEDNAGLVTVDALPSYRQVGVWLPSTNGEWATAQILVELTAEDSGKMVVRLRNMKDTSDVSYDNARMITAQPGAEIKIVKDNGAVVNEIETNTAASYTAKATYTGEEKGAMLYLAVYSKDELGVRRLVNVTGAPVACDGTQSRVKLEQINAAAGTTIVKAFILDSENSVIENKTIE